MSSGFRRQPIEVGTTGRCPQSEKSRSLKDLNLIAAASPATAAASASLATALTAAASAVASTTAAVFGLGTRFIYVEGASTHLRAIQCRNGFVSIFIAGHFHKTKSARAPGIAVGHDADPVHLPEWFKHLAQFVFRRVEA